MTPFKRTRFERAEAGFSLIELMIVLAVATTLLAIAVPAYQEYVKRAQRANARAALLQTAQWMERAATAQGRYPAALATGVASVQGGKYAVALTARTDATFTLTATRQGSQSNDKCGDYTLTNTGLKGVQNASLSVQDCWQR